MAEKKYTRAIRKLTHQSQIRPIFDSPPKERGGTGRRIYYLGKIDDYDAKLVFFPGSPYTLEAKTEEELNQIHKTALERLIPHLE